MIAPLCAHARGVADPPATDDEDRSIHSSLYEGQTYGFKPFFEEVIWTLRDLLRSIAEDDGDLLPRRASRSHRLSVRFGEEPRGEE